MSISAITGSREPLDVISPICDRLALLTDLISQANGNIGSTVQLSPRAVDGLYWFLREIEEDLEAVLPRLHELPLEV